MTPKEKAVELFDKFNSFIPMESSLSDTVEEANRKCINDHNATKQCALAAVNEIIDMTGIEFLAIDIYLYYCEVKEELEKM